MYIIIVRTEYTRKLQVYNRPDPLDSCENGWEAAVLPAFLGTYPGAASDAITAASEDHGIVPEALLALKI